MGMLEALSVPDFIIKTFVDDPVEVSVMLRVQHAAKITEDCLKALEDGRGNIQELCGSLHKCLQELQQLCPLIKMYASIHGTYYRKLSKFQETFELMARSAFLAQLHLELGKRVQKFAVDCENYQPSSLKEVICKILSQPCQTPMGAELPIPGYSERAVGARDITPPPASNTCLNVGQMRHTLHGASNGSSGSAQDRFQRPSNARSTTVPLGPSFPDSGPLGRDGDAGMTLPSVPHRLLEARMPHMLPLHQVFGPVANPWAGPPGKMAFLSIPPTAGQLGGLPAVQSTGSLLPSNAFARVEARQQCLGSASPGVGPYVQPPLGESGRPANSIRGHLGSLGNVLGMTGRTGKGAPGQSHEGFAPAPPSGGTRGAQSYAPFLADSVLSGAAPRGFDPQAHSSAANVGTNPAFQYLLQHCGRTLGPSKCQATTAPANASGAGDEVSASISRQRHSRVSAPLESGQHWMPPLQAVREPYEQCQRLPGKSVPHIPSSMPPSAWDGLLSEAGLEARARRHGGDAKCYFRSALIPRDHQTAGSEARGAGRAPAGQSHEDHSNCLEMPAMLQPHVGEEAAAEGAKLGAGNTALGPASRERPDEAMPGGAPNLEACGTVEPPVQAGIHVMRATVVETALQMVRKGSVQSFLQPQHQAGPSLLAPVCQIHQPCLRGSTAHPRQQQPASDLGGGAKRMISNVGGHEWESNPCPHSIRLGATIHLSDADQGVQVPSMRAFAVTSNAALVPNSFSYRPQEPQPGSGCAPGGGTGTLSGRQNGLPNIQPQEWSFGGGANANLGGLFERPREFGPRRRSPGAGGTCAYADGPGQRNVMAAAAPQRDGAALGVQPDGGTGGVEQLRQNYAAAATQREVSAGVFGALWQGEGAATGGRPEGSKDDALDTVGIDDGNVILSQSFEPFVQCSQVALEPTLWSHSVRPCAEHEDAGLSGQGRAILTQGAVEKAAAHNLSSRVDPAGNAGDAAPASHMPHSGQPAASADLRQAPGLNPSSVVGPQIQGTTEGGPSPFRHPPCLREQDAPAVPDRGACQTSFQPPLHHWMPAQRHERVPAEGGTGAREDRARLPGATRPHAQTGRGVGARTDLSSSQSQGAARERDNSDSGADRHAGVQPARGRSPEDQATYSRSGPSQVEPAGGGTQTQQGSFAFRAEGVAGGSVWPEQPTPPLISPPRHDPAPSRSLGSPLPSQPATQGPAPRECGGTSPAAEVLCVSADFAGAARVALEGAQAGNEGAHLRNSPHPDGVEPLFLSQPPAACGAEAGPPSAAKPQQGACGMDSGRSREEHPGTGGETPLLQCKEDRLIRFPPGVLGKSGSTAGQRLVQHVGAVVGRRSPVGRGAQQEECTGAGVGSLQPFCHTAGMAGCSLQLGQEPCTALSKTGQGCRHMPGVGALECTPAGGNIPPCSVERPSTSTIAQALGEVTAVVTGTTGTSRDVVSNTDELLDGSEPQSGNDRPLLPGAVRVEGGVAAVSQRDSNSPKTHAGAQRALQNGAICGRSLFMTPVDTEPLGRPTPSEGPGLAPIRIAVNPHEPPAGLTPVHPNAVSLAQGPTPVDPGSHLLGPAKNAAMRRDGNLPLASQRERHQWGPASPLPSDQAPSDDSSQRRLPLAQLASFGNHAASLLQGVRSPDEEASASKVAPGPAGKQALSGARMQRTASCRSAQQDCADASQGLSQARSGLRPSPPCSPPSGPGEGIVAADAEGSGGPPGTTSGGVAGYEKPSSRFATALEGRESGLESSKWGGRPLAVETVTLGVPHPSGMSLYESQMELQLCQGTAGLGAPSSGPFTRKRPHSGISIGPRLEEGGSQAWPAQGKRQCLEGIGSLGGEVRGAEEGGLGLDLPPTQPPSTDPFHTATGMGPISGSTGLQLQIGSEEQDDRVGQM
eukprot:jgi/Botrbrau1/15786/Bobra.4_1s0138.2